MNRFFFFSPLAALVLVPVLVGCSSASESGGQSGDNESRGPDEVFAVESAGGADVAQVTGIWETSEPTKAGPLEQRLRFELRADYVIAAARCTTTDGSAEPVVAGARVDGKVSDDSIALAQKIEATKQMGNVALCGVKVAAGAVPRCTETDATKRKMCFALEEGTLTLYQPSGPRAFVKIAD